MLGLPTRCPLCRTTPVLTNAPFRGEVGYCCQCGCPGQSIAEPIARKKWEQFAANPFEFLKLQKEEQARHMEALSIRFVDGKLMKFTHEGEFPL